MFALKTAFRYAFSKTGGRRKKSILLSLGIGAGITALMLVSAVMNGLQGAQLKHLRNIESYDLTVVTSLLSADDFKKIDPDCRVYETCETPVLITDKKSGMSTSARVRGVSEELINDPRFSESLIFYSDYEDLDNLAAISISMMNTLSVTFSDEIEFTFLRPGKTASIVPYSYRSSFGGLYYSYISEYSSNTVLMDINAVREINPNTTTVYAVYTDLNTAAFKNSILSSDRNASVATWQEYNRALYSALTLEKTVMYIFLAFMFLILCVNLKNTTSRLIRNKKKEGAVLLSLGCTARKLNFIFVLQSLLICISGEISGVLIGTLAVSEIDGILAVTDSIIYAVTSRRTVLTAIPFSAEIGFKEVSLICAGVLLLAFNLVYFGCRKAFKKEIMEVLSDVSD